jgi:hypothetical protein
MSSEFLIKLWRLVHLFFAFSFVGSVVVAEWNGRAARATTDWGQRAILFQVAFLAGRNYGFASLVLLGVFGNIASLGLGYSMRADNWMHWVNGLWIVTVAVMVLLVLPAAGRLAAASHAAAAGGTAEGFDSALARWRIGNVVLSLLYLALLVLMVYAWRSQA